MKLHFIYIATFSLVLNGCTLFLGSGSGYGTGINRKILVTPIQLADSAKAQALSIDDCDVYGTMDRAIYENDSKFGLHAINVSDPISEDYDVLVRTYIYDIHATGIELFSGISYSPITGVIPEGRNDPAAMKFRVEVWKNGFLLKQVDKKIHTKSFANTCQRIEKVANAAGFFVLKWTAEVLSKYEKS